MVNFALRGRAIAARGAVAGDFTVWLRGADRFERSEHYVENGEPPPAAGDEAGDDEIVAYRRVPE